MRLFQEFQTQLDSLLFNLGGSFGGPLWETIWTNNHLNWKTYWLFDFGVNYELSEGCQDFWQALKIYLIRVFIYSFMDTALHPGEGRKTTVGLRFSF